MSSSFLADRALIRLSGEDVRGFLQGLVTNDVSGPLPVWAGLLTAQGKTLFDFLVWADGEDLLIDCEAGQAEALARRLTLYRLRRKIEIARDPALGVHWNPASERGVPDPRLSELGHRWIGAVAEAPGAEAAWRAHRLALGVCEGAAEIGQDKTLWLEANATELHGVSFTKGCYVGQENTARMNWRQKVNRRLIVTRADTDPGEAARIYYPELGFAVRQIRVADIPADARAIRPAWLEDALHPEEAQ